MAQYLLVKLLASKHLNLCVVGDDDQSIYSWRGADIKNILSFEKTFENAEVIKLEQNYRSTQVILDTANAVISNNFGRKSKSLWTENNEGTKIKYFRAESNLAEGAFIADKILESIKDNGTFKDHGILYRTNAQSRAIEDQLARKSIPYRLIGGVRFYERKEIKDILAYLKLIYNPEDNLAAIRIINVPKRGIGDGSIARVLEYAQENNMTFLQALDKVDNMSGLGNRSKRLEQFKIMIDGIIEYSRGHDVLEIVNLVLEETKYIAELASEGTEESQGRIENIEELINRAAHFVRNVEDSSLSAFLEDVALVADIDNYAETDDCVTLMTLHSAKGLEFPTVFIPGFEEGIFPGYRTITSPDENMLEEERRLCYVGITRAKKLLYITNCVSRLSYGKTVSNSISRFLNEIPKDYIENISVVKSNKTSVTTKPAVSTSKSMKGRSMLNKVPAPQNITIDFEVGDKVKQLKYGVGTVKEIKNAGADFEVSVQFDNGEVKKFMAHLSKLKKVSQ